METIGTSCPTNGGTFGTNITVTVDSTNGTIG